MFCDISEVVLERMHYLEQIDARDRTDGTERMQRLRQIPPVTGKFIALWAASVPDGKCIEIGTSAGYSTLWLGLACRQTGKTITTFEVLEEKVALARETFGHCDLGDVVEIVHGDARNHIEAYDDISFCFLDAEKEVYLDCYEAVVPRMVRGGILIADNATNHAETLRPMLERALSDERVDAMIVPVGKGELVCRKI